MFDQSERRLGYPHSLVVNLLVRRIPLRCDSRSAPASHFDALVITVASTMNPPDFRSSRWGYHSVRSRPLLLGMIRESVSLAGI